MPADDTLVQCVRCGFPAGGAARRGAVCPGCLLTEGMARPADANWVRDRFPQLVEAVEAPGWEDGKSRVFEARDFESGGAVLLSLWPLAAEGAARQLAELERRMNLTHSGIARVLDFGEVDDWLYAIEVRPAGQRLREAIGMAEVSRGDMLRLVPEISAAVRYAAEQGVSIGAEPDTVFITGEGRVTLSGIPGATPVPREPDSVAWVEHHPAVGTRVGRYELLELIGEGGFAEVYRAREERPVRREVALKILKPGMDTRQVLARFARERQALAMMSHRGIATIFDAGATEAGRPWIAMELVPGQPLTAFCDARSLTLRDRAALLAAVCRAVHHGHEKGVVHRDLKPSNLLVAEEDGAPAAKVIDFGIATAAAEQPGGGTFFTRTHQFLGSPCYMSPEQVNGAEVDGRSDVYSLGAVLYELLTGEPPLTESAVKDRGLREVIESVQRQPAEHPADRVAGFADERCAAVAAARGVKPAEITGALSGELSGIALKALEKNPAERYESAAALAEDLENWVRGQPVRASIPRRRAARRVLSALRWAAVVALMALGVAWFWNQKPPALSAMEAPAWAVRHPVRSRAEDGSIKPVALFQFDGDLRSGISGGPDMEAIGAPELSFESAVLGGAEAQVMRAPRFLPSQWLKSSNVIGINGPPDATESNEWTLVFDVMFPSLTGPVALFQCDSENRAVAEIYAGPGGLGDTDYGIQYGQLREGEWYRIAVVSSVSDRSQLYATWVNGARWGVPHVRGMNSAQFAFDDALLFFCEGNQKTGAFTVNSLAVYDVPLTDHEIRALGAPSAAGVPAALHPGPARDEPGLLRAAGRMGAADVQPGDNFGAAVVTAGDEAWISATGSDAAAQNAGIIHRSRRDESGAWRLDGRLPVQALSGARLGTSLALSPLAGVAGGNGVAWLFTRGDAAAEWQAVALGCPDIREGARFGAAVALPDKAGTVAAVSAPATATRGSVFLYEVPGGKLTATLSPPDSSGFGGALAATDGKLIVGDAGGKVFTFLADAGGAWSQQSVLDGATMNLPRGAHFGHALAMSPNGAWLAVGAPVDAKTNGDGVVCVFAAAKDGAWTLRHSLRAPDDGAPQTEFGTALAFSGPDRLLIGAPGAVSEGRRTGGVHLMARQADDSWRRARFIAPEDGSQEGKFGTSLAADEHSAWIGAPEDHTDHAKGGGVWRVALPQFEQQQFATESPDIARGTAVAIRGALAVAGTPGRDERAHGGTAHVFALEDGHWREAGQLLPGNAGAPGGSFGQVNFAGDEIWSTLSGAAHGFRRSADGRWTSQRSRTVGLLFSVATSTDWLLAPQDGWLAAQTLATEPTTEPLRVPCSCGRHSAVALENGRALVALTDEARAVAVLEQSENSWHQRAVLTAPVGGGWFGRAVALHGDCALIGAPACDRSGAGQGDGRAHLFRRTAAGWKLEQTLDSPAAPDRSAFGSAVALQGDLALVACPRVAQGLSHGTVEVFRRNAAGQWRHDRTLEASDAEPGDGFGTHLALDGAWAIIGTKAPRVYFFRLAPQGTWEQP